MITIKFLPESHEALAYKGEEVIGEINYIAQADHWVITHTGVRGDYRGQGIATRLVEEIANQARLSNVTIDPACWYAELELTRKPQYEGLLYNNKTNI